MEGLAQYGDSDSDAEQPFHSAPVPTAAGLARRDLTDHSSHTAQHAIQSTAKPAPTALPSAAALFSQGGSSSALAGDLPGIKRSTPSSAAARQQAPPGAQRAPRRGGLSSATQGRNSAASAFLPPQLKGRANVVTEDLDRMGVKRRRGGAVAQAGQER